jgi:hypothetical protein
MGDRLALLICVAAIAFVWFAARSRGGAAPKDPESRLLRVCRTTPLAHSA